MKISAALIDKSIYIFLFAPILIFFAGWLSALPAIVCIAAVFIVLRLVFQNISKYNTGVLEINKYVFASAACIIALWCIHAGLGGLHYQSPDWHVRNAIMRDLVNYSYPVYYENNTSLVYYFGFMLPAAVLGRLAAFLGASDIAAFNAANIFLLLYSSVLIFLIFLELCILVKAKNYMPLAVLAVFILFSGADVLLSDADFSSMHIERHKLNLQYSSNTTLLFWVYNQAVPAWAVSVLFLRRPYNIADFGASASAALFFSPLPFIGAGCIFIFAAAVKFFAYAKSGKYLKFFKQAFSLQNIISLSFIFPVFFLFYKSIAVSSSKLIFSMLFLAPFWYTFFICEAGLYLLCIYHRYYKNPLFKITFLSLIFIPCFSIGLECDFCMRVSIPALFILMYFVIKSLKCGRCSFILTVILILGSVTPLCEFYRGYYLKDKEPEVKDEIWTLNNKIKEDACSLKPAGTGEFSLKNYINYCNYGSLNPQNSLFFKYLAKKNAHSS